VPLDLTELNLTTAFVNSLCLIVLTDSRTSAAPIIMNLVNFSKASSCNLPYMTIKM